MAGYGNKYLRKNGEQTRITAEQVEESVEGSLQRLNTDYIDLLQVKELVHSLSTFARQPHSEAITRLCGLAILSLICIVEQSWMLITVSSYRYIGQTGMSRSLEQQRMIQSMSERTSPLRNS